jgi:hypothetical protein
MNDREREERAIRQLEQAGYRVMRQIGGVRDGWWIVTDRASGVETASMDNLAALIELAEAIRAHGRPLTPSA